MTSSMHMAGIHLPAQVDCLCIAAPSSSAIRFALGSRTGISLVVHQICIVGDDESCSGYGFGSAHFVMILEEAMLVSGGVVTSEVTSAVGSVDAVTSAVAFEVTSDVTSEPVDVVAAVGDRRVRRKLNMLVAWSSCELACN